MLESRTAKKYTGADVYAAAIQMVKDEMKALKNNKPLDAEEAAKAEALAKFISRTVLKEIN